MVIVIVPTIQTVICARAVRLQSSEGPLGRSVINDQVLPFDPAMIAQAVQPHVEHRHVFRRVIKIADPARRPLCPRTSWRNDQRRTGEMNSRRFIPSSRSLRTTGRRVSRLDCGRTHRGCKCCVANASRGARRYGSIATVRRFNSRDGCVKQVRLATSPTSGIT